MTYTMLEIEYYEFNGYRLDAKGRMLFRGNAAVSLPPKAVGTLLLLVENAGAVVDKEELLKKVWHDAIVEEAESCARHGCHRRDQTHHNLRSYGHGGHLWSSWFSCRFLLFGSWIAQRTADAHTTVLALPIRLAY